MFVTNKSIKLYKSLSSHSLVNPHLSQSFRNTQICLCTTSKGNENKTNYSNIKLPEEPQNCCMSGCANCVWVAYAEELAKILNDGGETAKQKIMDHVKDPNLRAFLLLELSHLFKENK